MVRLLTATGLLFAVTLVFHPATRAVRRSGGAQPATLGRASAGDMLAQTTPRYIQNNLWMPGARLRPHSFVNPAARLSRKKIS